MADILAPSIALGCVFGRIGCLLNGCCYGRACNLPWAIRFPADNPLNPPTYPVHPTQIYDSLLNLGLYAVLAWLYRRKKFDGQVFGVYLVCYAVLRSFVEMFRGDYPEYQHYLGGWATPAHLVSILILAAGLVLLWAAAAPRSRSEDRGLRTADGSRARTPSSPSSIRHPRLLLLAGPTAVGKSEIALLLAERLGGEIVSVDSMQVYRGLDIGTAKPSPADRARVPHHLIDVVDVTEPFDAAQFVRLARRAVADIQSRGPAADPVRRDGALFQGVPGGIGRGAAGGCRVAGGAGSHALAGAAARTGRARPRDLRTH